MSSELERQAAKEMLKPVADLVRKLAGPLAEEAGEAIGAAASFYRLKLRVKMFQKAKKMLEDAGLSPQAVPPRLLLPIVDIASVEDDDDLNTRWAALLANASACPNSVHPSYIEILRQLTPEDARLLDRLYDNCQSKNTRYVQPWVDTISWAERDRRMEDGENPEIPFQNLVRLGLIEAEYELDKQRTKHGRLNRDGTVPIPQPELGTYDKLTEFAVRFVQACRAPKKNAPDTRQAEPDGI